MAILLVTSGCSTQDVPDSRENISSVREEIQGILDSFYKTHQRSGEGDEDGVPEVVDFSQRWYNIVGDTIEEVLPTRGANGDFAITTTVTNTNGSIGFSMMCLQANMMFISTTNGSVSDTTFNKGLKEYVEDAPLIAMDMIKRPITKDYQLAKALAGDPIIAAIDHLTVTEWDQKAPYNKYVEACNCATCTNENGGHRLLGCVPVALGQAIVKCGRFTPTFYGSKGKPLNVLAGKIRPVTEEEKNQVAHILAEIAINCGVRFGCTQSDAFAENAYRYMLELGYGCTLTNGELNLQKLITNLKKGCPHLMAGHNELGSGGHMWVVDGYKVVDNFAYYRCNWGSNGRCNGWVLNDPYSAINEYGILLARYSKKKQHIYINSK